MTTIYTGGDYFANIFRDLGDHESRTTALEAAMIALALRVTALEGLEVKRKAADSSSSKSKKAARADTAAKGD